MTDTTMKPKPAKPAAPVIPLFEMPKFDMPSFDMPKFELPKVELPQDATRVADFARDAAYVGLGAVVVTAKAADERRRELTGQVTSQFRKVAGTSA